MNETLLSLLPPGPYGISPDHARQFLAELSLIDLHAHVSAWQAAGRPGLKSLSAKDSGETTPRKPFAMSDAAAIIPITGVMSKAGAPSMGLDGTANTRYKVRQALTDPTVQQALILIDSPGGEVYGTSDLAADVKRLADAKPTFAYIEDLGASCAYWVASQCNAIFANSGAHVGCLGVRWTVVDSSKAAEQQGLAFDHIASGPYKAAGAEGVPVTPEHRAYIQGLVDAAARQFFGAVQRGRELTDEQLAAVTDGRLFPATAARSLKLIDGVRSLDNALAELKTYAPKTNAYKAAPKAV